MTKEKEKEVLGWMAFMTVFFTICGFMIGSTYELHHSKDIDIQHEEIVLEGDYIYCPYCGEEIRQ